MSKFLSWLSHPAQGSGLRAWLRTIGQNKFAFDPVFIPKAFVITFIILLGFPFRLYERLRYGRSIRRHEVREPVFIIGHPRSGTTFLHYLMSKDEQFAFCSTYQALFPHIFLTWKRVFPALLRKALPGKRPMDNLNMGAALPKEEEFAMAGMGSESLVACYMFPRFFMRNFKNNVLFEDDGNVAAANWKRNFDFLLKKLCYSGRNKRLLLKSPGNTGRIPQILELYPDAKFIHIYRNPMDVYVSNIHLYAKLLPLFSFQRLNEKQIESFVLESYELMMKKYLHDKVLIPAENLYELKYEDFEKNPLQSLRYIYDGIKIKGFEQATAFFREELENYEDYKKNVFTPAEEEKHSVFRRWAFAFKAFGYSDSLSS